MTLALASHVSQSLKCHIPHHQEYTCSVQCVTQQLGVRKNFTFFWQEDKCPKIVYIKPAFRQIWDIGFSGRLKHNISSVPMHSNTHLCRHTHCAGLSSTTPMSHKQNYPFKDLYRRYNTDIQTLVIWKQNEWKRNPHIENTFPKRSKWSLWHEVNFETNIFRQI